MSVVNKQYKTKEINSLGPEKLICYISGILLLDLLISSFHCTLQGAINLAPHRRTLHP